jgi:RNA polymerase sigma-70 factor (ECF subfamily)
LLLRVGRGDQSAFEALYDRIIGTVLGMARRVLRDEAQAEEVAQEVMIEVWRTAPRFDETRGSARAWVATLAHRRAVDRVRAAQAGIERERKVAVREQSVDYDEVAEAVETSFERDEVRKAMEGLSNLQREAIELAYFEGCTQREVAERLDIPLGTAKTRLRDGLMRMRDLLAVT